MKLTGGVTGDIYLDANGTRKADEYLYMISNLTLTDAYRYDYANDKLVQVVPQVYWQKGINTPPTDPICGWDYPDSVKPCPMRMLNF